MLYKVTVGRDQYVGTPEEVVAFMVRAEGAPRGQPSDYMQGIAARIQERTDGSRIDPSSPQAFLLSLRDAGLLRLEERAEASTAPEDPAVLDDVLHQGLLTFGDGVDPSDLEDL